MPVQCASLAPPAKNNSKRIPVTTRGTHTHVLPRGGAYLVASLHLVVRPGAQEKKVFPATTQASKDTPEDRRVPSYDESIQGHPNKKEGKEGKEKREREREEEDRFSQLRTSVQGHTREKGVNLSITFRNTPTSERGREGWGEEGEEGGLSPRSLRPRTACPRAATFDRCGHVKACASLEFNTSASLGK